MYKGHLNITAFDRVRVAQSVERRTSNLRTVVSNPTVGKNCSFFIFCRFRCAPGRSTGPIQLESSMTR